MSEATLPRGNSYVAPEHVHCRKRMPSGGPGIQRCSDDLPQLGLFRARSRAENATACRHRVVGCYRLGVKRFSALHRLRESIRTAGQMSTVLHRNDKNDKNDKNALPPTRNLQAPGGCTIGRIRGAGDKLKLCSLAFTPCSSVWCGSPSTIPITFSS
jgi:hypothetical protein